MSSNGKFPCPKGCGSDFKTNSAAYAHAHHCKFEAPVEPDPVVDNPPAPELSPSDQAIVGRLTATILPQIEEGMAGLQERVQTNLFTGLAEAIPKMVAQEVQSTAEKFMEGVKSNPGSGEASSMSSLIDMADRINTFLNTPLGKILEKKFMKGGGTPKGNIGDWRRGATLAVRMLGANKSDPDATAEMIKEFAAPYKGRTGNDLFRGMYDTAEMFRPKKGEPETKPKEKPKVEEKEKTE